ncbi:hypothetical protein OG948_39475 (plasmid) [Embleya sp. NBC_00888]|uniref:hypothetical protein n=1 Tax=Embleya sp. NBC_00888 TaxID=2975960 RepID=UPI002F90876B|nr:hypothetical protein OG948_39475 [Embleya sp. NBC_00888]
MTTTGPLTTTVEITADDAGTGVRDSVTAKSGTVLEVSGTIVGKVAANSVATYVWTVRNTTGVQAEKVSLSMDGPSVRQGHFLNSAPPPASRDDGKVVWNLGTLPGNSAKNAIAVFTLQPDQGGKKLGPTAAEAKAANAETVAAKDKPRRSPTLLSPSPAFVKPPTKGGC